MKFSIIIPVYNEKKTIKEIVDRVQKHDYDKEIIIVDDGSQDGTVELLKEIKESNIKINYHDKNRGKGAAIRTALKNVSGDVVIIQDADLEYDPQEYPKLLKPIMDGKADVVYGSRFMGGSPHRVSYFWHYIGNKILTAMSNMFTNLNLTDMETGYKVFKKEILSQINLKEKRFGIEPEMTAKIAKLDCRIYEVGIPYSGRTYKEGKKINWKDGIWAIWCILKYGLFS